MLTVTCLDDPTADLVLAELHDRDIPVVRFDPGADFPGDSGLETRFGADGMSGSLTTATRMLELASVRSVYWRKPTPYRRSPYLDEQTGRWTADQSRFGLGGVLATLPGALYLNHPWRIRDAEHKPVQLATAAACGLTIPPTLITNNPESARTFAESGPIVYKPLWASEYIGPDDAPRNVWTQTVSPEEMNSSISGAAHLFQRRVDKIADVRVTVVGKEVFPVRIDGASGLDWRQHYPDLSYTPIETPPPMARAIRAYLDRFGLIFGAFDFAVAPDGEWIFLECNPNGQWAWFPDPIPARIAAAIADHLQAAKDRV
ncbi:ATP-grasp ribosomal peptide maturase [Sphaerisporangium sp. NPDC051017]|uniref:ATP-grasp ribosomal peptide maturase n=1 Tax=unclassified Sphaerisporangium TaxID=2630420 RepID=UPI0033D36BE7